MVIFVLEVMQIHTFHLSWFCSKCPISAMFVFFPSQNTMQKTKS